ncbi:MAG: DEAD/DEAH box helicase [Candidatus Accumulibacter sp.]|uniref:DEAD/DEAH box helicase n=2 Tax=Accumulibacter sp. TaxID=2053492 RepID=UPI001B044D99|nr:DEAD/DEAH box helicase [Accumulibacter sp.]MBO3704278.1 DEAD/DEAH box helicase [Accumulibacter sp.]
MSIDLRPYQSDLVDNTRLSLAGGNRRVVLYLPTGAGKTRTAAAIICMALAKGRKVVFVANRKQLVLQTSGVLHGLGIEHGILQADNTRNLGARVLVASIDTVHLRGLPDDIGLIIIDECHSVAGSLKLKQIMFSRNLVPVIGLTATPFAAGMAKPYKELGGALFEDLVIGATVADLIADGHLVDCDIYAPSEPDLKGVRSSKGIDGETDFRQSDLAKAVDKPSLIGDIRDHWFRLARGKQTVVFATDIPHSRHIVETFQAAGVAAEHIDYRMDDEERAAILKSFASGATTVLSNCALLSEGWDCPTAEVMLLARPTRSLIRYIQMVGRVLRPAPGKERALLIDHSGSTARLGHPCDDLPLTLDDGKPRVSGSKSTERRESLPTKCAKCSLMKPAKVHECPACGFAPERQNKVETIDGTLVKQSRKKPVTKVVKQHVFSQLLFLQQKRSYRRGWAANQYRSFFDVWPKGLAEVAATPTQEVINKVQANAIAFAKRKEAGHAAA